MDYERWQSYNFQDLIDEFLEKNKKINMEFEYFCQEKFESHKQSQDDYIADTQINDFLLEK